MRKDREERQPDEEPGRQDRSGEPEDRPGEPGAEGGSKSASSDKLPGAPGDDDSPLGDTDQHSSG